RFDHGEHRASAAARSDTRDSSTESARCRANAIASARRRAGAPRASRARDAPRRRGAAASSSRNGAAVGELLLEQVADDRTSDEGQEIGRADELAALALPLADEGPNLGRQEAALHEVVDVDPGLADRF